MSLTLLGKTLKFSDLDWSQFGIPLEDLANMDLAEVFIDADEGVGGGVSSFLYPQDIAIPTSIEYYLQFNFNFQRSSLIVPSGSSITFPAE